MQLTRGVDEYVWLAIVPAALLTIAIEELTTCEELCCEGFDGGEYANEDISTARGIGRAMKDEHKGPVNGLQ